MIAQKVIDSRFFCVTVWTNIQNGLVCKNKSIFEDQPKVVAATIKLGQYIADKLKLKSVNRLRDLLSKKGCKDYRPGPVAKAGVPFSLWKGPSVGPQDEERFKAYGAEFGV